MGKIERFQRPSLWDVEWLVATVGHYYEEMPSKVQRGEREVRLVRPVNQTMIRLTLVRTPCAHRAQPTRH